MKKVVSSDKKRDLGNARIFWNIFRLIDALNTFSNDKFEVVTTILTPDGTQEKNEDPCNAFLSDLSLEVLEKKFAN